MSDRTRPAGIAIAAGKRLRAIRESRGLSLAQAAALAGGTLSSVSIGQYETGGRAPSLDRLAELCEAYGVGIHEVLPYPPLVTATFTASTRAQELVRDEMAARYEDELDGLRARIAELEALIPAEVA